MLSWAVAFLIILFNVKCSMLNVKLGCRLPYYFISMLNVKC